VRRCRVGVNPLAIVVTEGLATALRLRAFFQPPFQKHRSAFLADVEPVDETRRYNCCRYPESGEKRRLSRDVVVWIKGVDPRKSMVGSE
jgi:hypothetical protein